MYSAEDLQRANEAIKSTDIKGKDYAEVSQRIKAFRSVCPHGAIITEMISNAPKVDGRENICIFRATVYDEEKNIIGTGTAYEEEGSSFINKTSYIENCETSAVGRALAMCGFGVDGNVSSADETKNAQNNQDKKKQEKKSQKAEESPRKLLIAKLKEKGVDIDEYAKEKGLTNKTTPERFAELLKELGE